MEEAKTNETISLNQWFVLVLLYVIGDAVMIIPSILSRAAGVNAWVVGLAGLGLGLLFVWFFHMLAMRHPKLNFVQYSERILGKWVGSVVIWLYISYGFILGCAMLFELGNFITSHLMVETPIQAIQSLFLILILLSLSLGLAPLARTAEILFPWVLFLFALVVFLMLPELDWKHLMPAFHMSGKEWLRGIYSFSGLPLLENVLLLMLYPAIRHTGQDRGKPILRTFLLSVFFGGLIIVVMTLLCTLVLGAELSVENVYPTFVLSRRIMLFEVVERIEVVIAGIWFISLFVKASLAFYVTLRGIATYFKLKSDKPVILPLLFVALPLSLMILPNGAYFSVMTFGYFPAYDYIVGLGLPMLLFVVSLLRKTNRKP